MRKLFLLAAVCTLWLTFTGSAASTVYDVNVPVGVGSVTGTITTDATIGPLFASDITAIDLILFPGARTAEVNNVNGLVSFISSGALIATTSDLTFNFNLNGPSMNCGPLSGLCAPQWSVHTDGGTLRATALLATAWANQRSYPLAWVTRRYYQRT